jgi:hypothetical protein
MAVKLAGQFFKPYEDYGTGNRELTPFGSSLPGDGPTREDQGIKLKAIADGQGAFKFDVAIPQVIDFLKGTGLAHCYGVVEGVYDIPKQVVVEKSVREGAVLQERHDVELIVNFLRNLLFRTRTVKVHGGPSGDDYPPVGTYNVKMNCTASFATYIKNAEAEEHLADFVECYRQVYGRFTLIARTQKGATEEELWKNLYISCIKNDFKGAVPDEKKDFPGGGKNWHNPVAWLWQLGQFYYQLACLSSDRDHDRAGQPAQHIVSGYNLYWAGDKEQTFGTLKVPPMTIVYEPFREDYTPVSSTEVVSKQKISGLFAERILPDVPE